jgi:hypothetical protein
MLERRLIHPIFFCSWRETALAVMIVILLCKVVFEFAANLERNNSGENEKTVQGRSNLGFAHRPLSTSHDPNAYACCKSLFGIVLVSSTVTHIKITITITRLHKRDVA